MTVWGYNNQTWKQGKNNDFLALSTRIFPVWIYEKKTIEKDKKNEIRN